MERLWGSKEIKSLALSWVSLSLTLIGSWALSRRPSYISTDKGNGIGHGDLKRDKRRDLTMVGVDCRGFQVGKDWRAHWRCKQLLDVMAAAVLW